MSFEQSLSNFRSHRFMTVLVSTVDGREYYTYCPDCGIEHLGDPCEFPDLLYLPCEESGDQ